MSCQYPDCDDAGQWRGYCKRHYNHVIRNALRRERKLANPPSPTKPPRLSFQPFLDFIDGYSYKKLGKEVKADITSTRCREKGIPFWVADRLAIAVHAHPHDIWGEEWIEALKWTPSPKHPSSGTGSPTSSRRSTTRT